MNSTSTIYKGFQQLALLVVTPLCFEKYFVDFDFFNESCFASTLSKGLGIGIMVGSIFVKFPQIIKIYKAKTAAGISLISITSELIVISIYAAYNYLKEFPISAWGETAFLAIQTAIIGFLLLFYDMSILKAFAYLITYSVMTGILLSGAIPMNILWTLQTVNIPILLAGRIVQIYSNYCNGSTGQLSAVTYGMLLSGSAARIFTSIQETGDTVIIATNVSSFLANLVIVAQLAYYWKTETKLKKVD